LRFNVDVFGGDVFGGDVLGDDDVIVTNGCNVNVTNGDDVMVVTTLG